MRSIPREKVRAFLTAIAPGLRFGSVTVTVHDGEPRKVDVNESVTLAEEKPKSAARPQA